MKQIIFKSAVFIFTLLTKRKYHRFIKSLENPSFTQDRVLQEILKILNATKYGKNLGRVESYQEYVKKIPLVEYDDIKPFIEKTIEGQKNIIVVKKVKHYEKTSGSSSYNKNIPYTDDIIRDFTEMFQYWAYDILKNGPALHTGTFYFSVSPQFVDDSQKIKDTKLKTFSSDEDYLSGWIKYLLKPFFAVQPNELELVQNADEFKRKLLEKLKNCKDLEIISVWNPSFLTEILKQTKLETKNLFPSLKIISCWGDSMAKYDLKSLQDYFPNIYIQPKGLLATEAPMTLPLINASAPVPLIKNIFFEFIDENNDLKRIHELRDQENYELVISQKSGLYRYRIGDRVQVRGFYKKTPCLVFIGRSQQVSDLVGEKITESFLEDFFENSNSFQIIIPSKQQKRYFIISENTDNENQFEDFLQTSFHYKNARKLGQLDKVKGIQTNQKLEEMILNFFEKKRQMKRGDIKFRRLYSQEWDDHFLDYLLKHSRSK